MILHRDGFDHYGTGIDNGTTAAILADAGYSFVSGNPFTVVASIAGGTIIPRTGLGMLFAAAIQGYIKRPLISAVKQSGQIGILFNGAYPIGEQWGYCFEDAVGTRFLCVMFRPNGGVNVCTNPNSPTTTSLGQLQPGFVKLNTWQDWEFTYTPNTGLGTVPSPFNGQVTVSLEGVPMLIINGLSISTATGAHGLGVQGIVGGAQPICLDDWIINDVTGVAPANACPLGPRRVGTRIVTGAGLNNQWTPQGGANAVACVGKNTPTKTSYIIAQNPGDLQDFTLSASPVVVAGVTDVMVKAYAQKSTAGAGTLKLGIQSGAVLSNSPAIPLGQSFVYWDGISLPTDPNTGLPWTKAAYDAIGVRCTRDA
jgi:hypothetical protein